MIDAKNLSKCIDNLAEINALVNDRNVKQLLLEVGYILKQELDTVKAWDTQMQNQHQGHILNVDVQKLLEDNNQLFNENRKLYDINMKLKETIDSKIPHVEEMVKKMGDGYKTLSQTLDKF